MSPLSSQRLDEEDPIFKAHPAARLNILDVQNVKKIPQILAQKGDKGDSVKGEDGKTPVKGKDYFTKQEIDEIIKIVQSRIEKPQDGYTPVLGEDYFTDEDVELLINDVLSRIREPKDGKDALVDYDMVIQEVLKLIPLPKDGRDGVDGRDGKDGIGKIGPRGPSGRDGVDGVVDTQEVRKAAQKPTQEHEEAYRHDLLHPPAQLGTKTVDEEGIADRKVLTYDAKKGKIVYSLPVKSTLKGGGGTTLPARTSHELEFLRVASDKTLEWAAASIPQLSSDPASPAAEDVWVLSTISGGSGGGVLKALFGAMPILTANSGGSQTYQLSYKTTEGTTKRVSLS